MKLDHSQLLGFKLPTGQVTGAKIGDIKPPDPKFALRLDPVAPQDAE